jgi:hypothetical protein
MCLIIPRNKEPVTSSLCWFESHCMSVDVCVVVCVRGPIILAGLPDDDAAHFCDGLLRVLVEMGDKLDLVRDRIDVVEGAGVGDGVCVVALGQGEVVVDDEQRPQLATHGSVLDVHEGAGVLSNAGEVVHHLDGPDLVRFGCPEATANALQVSAYAHARHVCDRVALGVFVAVELHPCDHLEALEIARDREIRQGCTNHTQLGEQGTLHARQGDSDGLVVAPSGGDDAGVLSGQCPLDFEHLRCELQGPTALGHFHVHVVEALDHPPLRVRVRLDDEAQANIGRHDVFRRQVAVVNVANEVPHAPLTKETPEVPDSVPPPHCLRDVHEDVEHDGHFGLGQDLHQSNKMCVKLTESW